MGVPESAGVSGGDEWVRRGGYADLEAIKRRIFSGEMYMKEAVRSDCRRGVGRGGEALEQGGVRVHQVHRSGRVEQAETADQMRNSERVQAGCDNQAAKHKRE
jgi:hypothetical protein